MTELNPKFTEATTVISHLSENEQLMALRLTATRTQSEKRQAECFADVKPKDKKCLQGPQQAGALLCSATGARSGRRMEE
jgi:hypothetical protein